MEEYHKITDIDSSQLPDHISWIARLEGLHIKIDRTTVVCAGDLIARKPLASVDCVKSQMPVLLKGDAWVIQGLSMGIRFEKQAMQWKYTLGAPVSGRLSNSIETCCISHHVAHLRIQCLAGPVIADVPKAP